MNSFTGADARSVDSHKRTAVNTLQLEQLQLHDKMLRMWLTLIPLSNGHGKKAILKFQL